MTLRAGAGLSVLPDPDEAAVEAARAALDALGAPRADLVLAFATPAYRPAYGRAVRRVRRETGAAHLVGCTGRGVIAGDVAVEDRPGLAVLAVTGVCATPFLVRPLRGRSAAAGYEIGTRIADRRAADDAIVLLPDPFGLDAEALFGGIAREAGRFLGVGAAPAENGVRTHAFAGDEAADDAVAGVHVAGPRVRAGVAHACRPIGPPGVVTASRANRVSGIDGRPAFEVLAALLPEAVCDDLRRLLTYVMAAFPVDPDRTDFAPGTFYVRAIVGLDPGNGVVAVAGDVPVGTPLAFVAREPIGARRALEEALRRLADGPAPAFGLYFDGAARGERLYGTPGVDAAIIARRLGGIPLAGVMGNAEIAPGPGGPVVHHHTGVLALFS